MCRSKKISYFFLVIYLISLMFCDAQTDAYFSNYTQNGIYINPAFAGYRPYLQVGLFYKRLNTGFGALQQNGLFTIDKPVWQQKMGIGGVVLHSNTPVLSCTNVSLNASYRIKIEKSTLSFGMNIGLNQIKKDPSLLKIEDKTDPMIASEKTITISPDLGSGLYFQHQKFFLGISAMHILTQNQTKLSFLSANILPHYYFIGGYNFKINEDFSLTPHFLIRYISTNQKLIDMGLHLKYKELFWFGANYRNQSMLSGQIGLKISDLILSGGYSDIKIGYAFDYNFNKIAVYTTSHELFLMIDFAPNVNINKVKKRKTQVSPLFF